jgi:hypothetical protein
MAFLRDAEVLEDRVTGLFESIKELSVCRTGREQRGGGKQGGGGYLVISTRM